MQTFDFDLLQKTEIKMAQIASINLDLSLTGETDDDLWLNGKRDYWDPYTRLDQAWTVGIACGLIRVEQVAVGWDALFNTKTSAGVRCLRSHGACACRAIFNGAAGIISRLGTSVQNQAAAAKVNMIAE